MFFMKFFYFYKGYVIIKVSTDDFLKIVDECIENDIKLFNVTYKESVYFTVEKRCYFRLAKIAKAHHVKLKISSKHGMAFLLKRYRKRAGFLIGALSCIIFFAVSSMFLWDIDVECENSEYNGAVLEALAQIGVKPGAFLPLMPDAYAMKEQLLKKFDNFTWAWVYVDGVRAKVCVHEKILPPTMVNENEPCNIIAARDGFIVKVACKKGNKVVSSGNAVNAGEVIISGEITPKSENKNTYFVHSDGDVEALTHYEQKQTYSLKRIHPQFTGRSKTTYSITVLSKTLNIFNKPNFDYCIERKTEFSPPFLGRHFNFKISCTVYEEAEKVIETVPKEWMVDFAKRDLSAQIAAKLCKNARKQNEEFIIEDGIDSITVNAKMDFIENIGIAENIN